MSNNDLTGQRFDMLTVLERTDKRVNRYIVWRCQCDCGNIVEVGSNNLRSKYRHSCGCHVRNSKVMEGERFHNLTALHPDPSCGTKWVFRCDCGVEKSISKSKVVSGQTVTCGSCEYHSKHLAKAKTTHGGAYTRFYELYKGMIKRCYYEKAINYHQYGGRGIYVCDEWRHDFQAFREWSESHGWREGLTLDRIDNDGPYSPDNCRWVDEVVQGNNRSTNKILEFRGESKTASQWADKLGIPRKTLYERLRRGWSTEDALTRPVGGCEGKDGTG